MFTQGFTASGIVWAIMGSYTRLTGYWDNGLRWNVPVQQVNKFDVTSDFEEKSIFKHWRIRE